MNKKYFSLAVVKADCQTAKFIFPPNVTAICMSSIVSVPSDVHLGLI